MPDGLNKVPNEPILIVNPQFGSSPEAIKTRLASSMQFIQALSEPVFLIIDLAEMSQKLTIDDVAVASDMAARQLHMFTHPNIRETVFVTSNRMLKLAIGNLDSEVYGFIKAQALNTLDDALAYVRDKI